MSTTVLTADTLCDISPFRLLTHPAFRITALKCRALTASVSDPSFAQASVSVIAYPSLSLHQGCPGLICQGLEGYPPAVPSHMYLQLFPSASCMPSHCSSGTQDDAGAPHADGIHALLTHADGGRRIRHATLCSNCQITIYETTYGGTESGPAARIVCGAGYCRRAPRPAAISNLGSHLERPARDSSRMMMITRGDLCRCVLDAQSVCCVFWIGLGIEDDGISAVTYQQIFDARAFKILLGYASVALCN